MPTLFNMVAQSDSNADALVRSQVLCPTELRVLK